MKYLVVHSLYWSRVVALGVVLGVSLQFAQAWTNPSVSAPGGNVAGPINTGAINQVKNAGLGLTGSLAVGGNVKLGNASALCDTVIAGTVRYNSTLKCVELCDGATWACVGESTPTPPASPASVDGVCGTSANSCVTGSVQTVKTSYNCAESYDCNFGVCAGSVACDTNAVGNRVGTSSSMCSIYSVCWGDGSYDTGTRCKCTRYVDWNCLGLNGGLNATCSLGIHW